MPISEQDILDNYEKELLKSFEQLTQHQNIKEISIDSFKYWSENNLPILVLSLVRKDINFNKLADEILRIALENEEKEILESYEKYDFSFNISEHYLGYFENNCLDNLTDKELETLKEFQKQYRYETYNNIYGTDFKNCKISNLQSNCYEMFFSKK